MARRRPASPANPTRPRPCHRPHAEQQRRRDIGHCAEDLRPVPAHLLVPTKCAVGMRRELARIVGREARRQRIEIVSIDRVAPDAPSRTRDRSGLHMHPPSHVFVGGHYSRRDRVAVYHRDDPSSPLAGRRRGPSRRTATKRSGTCSNRPHTSPGRSGPSPRRRPRRTHKPSPRARMGSASIARHSRSARNAPRLATSPVTQATTGCPLATASRSDSSPP